MMLKKFLAGSLCVLVLFWISVPVSAEDTDVIELKSDKFFQPDSIILQQPKVL